MNIIHSEMVTALAKSGAVIAAELTAGDANLLHMAVGISGEAAELLDAIQKAVLRDGELDGENVLEELGDLEFYTEGMRQELQVTRDECLAASMVEDLGDAPDLLTVAVDIVVVSGDIMDSVKRATIYRKPLDIGKIAHELGRLDRHMRTICKYRQLSRQDCLDANIAKLGKRYEGLKYSDTAAQDRADKQA